MKKTVYGLIMLSSLLFSCSTEKKDDLLKVGFLGAPSFPEVEWNDENMQRMKDLGFNAMQLNIAWGYRPADNPLNIEDVVEVPLEYQLPVDTTMLNQNTGETHVFLHSKEKIDARKRELKHRIGMCEKYGMRSIFHFGAPYVAYPATEPLSQCISDEKTLERYVTLLNKFYKEFPGVDDLLIYTYDQNAWQCQENGVCEKCYGVPLHLRVTKFINTLAQTWKKLNPDGRVWWEPWEISGGQTFAALELLDSTCVGLSLHASITEVQIALPADRWFKNMLTLASERNIPVIGEMWLGSATEEVEPYLSIPTPLATLRALRAMDQGGKLFGIKEYYGNIPNREDVNLRMTSIFFNNRNISDEEAMKVLAAPYGKAAEKIKEYWSLASEAIELYPWDISWFAREVGKSNPQHSMTAATLKGASWVTPSWQSNRRAAFMRTSETEYPHFWMLEDAQLRFDMTAEKISQALTVAEDVKNDIPAEYLEDFNQGVEELTGFRQRVVAYVCHIRETNICSMLREQLKRSGVLNEALIAELKIVLQRDKENQENSKMIADALALLEKNPKEFLDVYFIQYSDASKQPAHLLPADWGSVWSLTSK